MSLAEGELAIRRPKDRRPMVVRLVSSACRRVDRTPPLPTTDDEMTVEENNPAVVAADPGSSLRSPPPPQAQQADKPLLNRLLPSNDLWLVAMLGACIGLLIALLLWEGS